MRMQPISIAQRQEALEILNGEPWAIMPERLMGMAEIMTNPPEVDVLGDEGGIPIEAKRPIRSLQGTGAISVIPVYGVIQQKGNILMQIFGGTSTEALGQQIDAAMADPKISAIVLDVDSPGGSVYGVEELTSKIRAASGKPIIAVANSLMASAAYYISSAADEIIAQPSAEVGSIGVIAMHVDASKMLEAIGWDVTLITAGKYKAEGNPFEPLDEEALAAIQGRIDEYYGMFVNAVAAGRGVSRRSVRDGFGEGRVVSAATALDLKMIDRVATLDEILGSLSGRTRRNGTANAEDNRGLSVTVEVDGATVAETIITSAEGNEDPAEVEPVEASDGLSTDSRRRRLRLAERG